MIERTCDIVQMPDGNLAALMPLPGTAEKNWVAVKEDGPVLQSLGHVHREDMAQDIAARPWDESWEHLGRRHVVISEPDKDFDLGGGD